MISLSDYYGWESLAERIPVRCFMFEPTVKSSLKFLRRTPWARKKIEDLFVYTLEKYGADEDEEDEEDGEDEGDEGTSNIER